MPGVPHIAYLRYLARQALANKPRLFDSLQEAYSHEASPEQERYRRILDAVQLARKNVRGGRALEIGCARGLFTLRLVGVFDYVDAYDISQYACKLTSERCARFSNLQVRQIDVRREGLPGGYDVVFVMDTLEYIHGRRYLRSTIDNLVNALRPHGLLVFSDFRLEEELRRGWWQRWLPEGADQHIALLTARSELRLVSHDFHGNTDPPHPGYIDHLSAIFEKISSEF